MSQGRMRVLHCTVGSRSVRAGVTHVHTQASGEGFPETRTQTDVMVCDDTIGAPLVPNHIVDKVHRRVLGGVGIAGADTTCKPRKTANKSQDGVEGFSNTFNVGLGEVYCPVHMQVLPTVVRCTDQLCFAPRVSLDCTVALERDAG